MQGWYSSTDNTEVAIGELVGLDTSVSIVVRRYYMPMHALFSTESPIKFVPLHDIGDEDFDLAIYIPDYLFRSVPTAILMEGMESLIYVAGVTFHEDGPDAVSRLG